MPETEEAKAELRSHQWLCDQAWEKLDDAKGHLWKIEVERAKRYGRTDPIAGKADSVMWGIRKQMEGITNIRDKLEEEDPPEEKRTDTPLTKDEICQDIQEKLRATGQVYLLDLDVPLSITKGLFSLLDAKRKELAKARKVPEVQYDFEDVLFELITKDPPEERRSNMPLTKEDIRQIATSTADEVMDRIREREHDSLLLNSIPSAFGSPGIVVDETLAKATPCRYIEYKPGKRLAFSKGIVGALSDEQEEIYCPEWIKLDSPGLERRLANWMESVETCKAEIAEIPKGERLEPWLGCMSRELKAVGIEA